MFYDCYDEKIDYCMVKVKQGLLPLKKKKKIHKNILPITSSLFIHCLVVVRNMHAYVLCGLCLL